MKHVNFMMVALMVLMGTTVTSCMNGEDNTIVQGMEPMRVKDGYMGLPPTFISGGLEVVPTNSDAMDLSSCGDVALVPYEYDRALQEITINTKKLNVKLLEKPRSIDAQMYVFSNEEAAGEMFKSTHAVGTLSISNGYASIEPYIMPVLKGMRYENSSAEYFLITPIGYKVKSVQKEDELTAELKKHTFNLVLYTDDIENGETSMLVYLNHVINEEAVYEEDEKVERTMNYADYKAFNLTEAIAQFTAISGANPTKIFIKAMENNMSDDLKGANEISYEKTIKIEE